jgi:hypothetical protein
MVVVGDAVDAPTLRVGTSTANALRLDGALTEPFWRTVDSIENLTTVEPEEGGTPSGRTVVRVVLVAGADIVIGVRCYDPNPAGIVSFTRARDVALDDEDNVMIVLDTYRDGRTGYVFAINPDGARFDGLISANGEDVNSDWDAAWEARTSRDSRGWSAEIRIPVRSISFRRGLASWGFNVERNIQRLQETSRWSGISLDIEAYQTARAGLLTNIPPLEFGHGFAVRPSVVGQVDRQALTSSAGIAPSSYAGDLSVDASKRLGANLLGSLTWNTDFAETEVDARQTNLTRFDVLFPEKRAFFLDGSDIFEFGLGLNEDTFLPFFSRRIGLSNPEEGDPRKVPILGGGKLIGRVGNTSIGALTVRTDRADSVPASTMGAVRIRQNVLGESSVGMLATAGDPLGESGSWLAGVDLTYRTSTFLGDRRLLAGVWGLRNERNGVQGDNKAAGFTIKYPADLFNFELSGASIGDGFQPSLGFVPRTGVRRWYADFNLDPRPSWSLVRQMYHSAELELFTNRDNVWESFYSQVTPLQWDFESGDWIDLWVERSGDRPPESFAIFETERDTVVIPAGTHVWTRYWAEVGLAEKRRISGWVDYVFGEFYGGTLQTVIASVELKPSAYLTVEMGGERNHGKLPGGTFTQKLLSTRVSVTPSSDFGVTSFLQYDNESRSFGTNTRLRWTFNPLGDVFVVYNHNLRRSIARRDAFGFESSQLLVKLAYAVRL